MSENEMIVPDENKAVAIPDYLQDYEGDTGIEDIGAFTKPARLKIVQNMADASLKAEFEVGDLIATPARILVAKKGEVVQFAPLFFFPEWCKWNPYELKDSHPMISERTTDVNNPLVALCRDEKSREFEWPEKVKGKTVYGRNVEHLNFVVQILSGPAAGLVAVMSFFRAQHQDGTNFASLIKMRGKPIFSQVFEGKTYHKSYSGNEWEGFKAMNPSTCSPWATAEEFAARKEMYMDLKKAHELGQTIVDHEEPNDENVVEGSLVNSEEF